MKRDRFLAWIFGITAVYVSAVVIAFLLRSCDIARTYYDIFKDMAPIILSIPLAWLVYVFEKRNNYLKNARDQYSRVLKAVNRAIYYLEYVPQATRQQEYYAILSELSMAIDEVRADFKNPGAELNYVGYYPFEPIKEVHEQFKKSGLTNIPKEKEDLKNAIVEKWKEVRGQFLREFDRV